MRVTASATSTLSYAWRKDGSAIPGATNASYEVVDAQMSDAGSYSVLVTS
jgi:hypothetical protein